MEIIIGTYEEFLVGYKLATKNAGDTGAQRKPTLVLNRSFTKHAHNGSVRCIASCPKYVASGGTDEVIQLINIKHRLETGTLTAHGGTITSLEFLRSAYLFSAAEDSHICIWNASRRWECEKILRGHKDAITAINLHSSGKLLLSISKDKTLRTWNLIKGRCAYIVNLKEIAHQVLWSPTCILFGLTFDHHIDIYDIATGSIKYQIDKKSLPIDLKRINKFIFIDDNHVIITGDCPELVTYNINQNRTVNHFEAHKNRIKDLQLINLDNINDDSLGLDDYDIRRWLVTTSSDGYIKIWSIDIQNLEKNPKLITEVDSTCRPTCMAISLSGGKYEKFENYTVPELKLSEEELQACRLKTKMKKKKISEPSPKKRRLQTNSDSKVPRIESNLDNDDDDNDDDDDEAIQSMKSKSKVLKQMLKFKKGKKKNIQTFRMRNRLKGGDKNNGRKRNRFTVE